MIRLLKKGRPTKETQSIINSMNDLLDELDSANKYDFDKGYETEEELREAYSRMKEIKGGIGASSQSSSSSNIEDAKIESESKSQSSVQESEPDNFDFSSDLDFDPNEGDTIERIYNKPNIDIGATATIPEPIYSTETTPTVEDQEAKSEKQSSQSSQSQREEPRSEPKPEYKPINPALHEADEKTKRVAAEQLADTLLDGYDFLHQVARPIASVKEKKIIELEKKGLIDPTETISVQGSDVTLREIVDETNRGIGDALTPDPTFRAKVRPAMVRIFTKKGAGITDEQQLMISVGMDIGGKAMQIVSLRRTLNGLIDMFKESHKEKMKYYADQKRQTKQANVDSISTPPPTKEPVNEPELTATETVY